MSANNMQMVYQAMLNNGLSPQQARAFTAEVGRENDFQTRYLFGEHQDSNRANVGIISWNHGRRDNLYKFLKQKGIQVNGRKIEQTQRALDAQVAFALQEIRTLPSYKRTKEKFLDNPNVDYNTAQEVLGNNFIRWDYAGNNIGKKTAAKHHAKRDKYYAQLGGVSGAPNNTPEAPNYNYQPQTGQSLSDLFKSPYKAQSPAIDQTNIFSAYTNSLQSNAYEKEGKQIPVLSANGELVVPETKTEFDMFTKVADMNLTPEEETAKVKSIGLISELKNSLSTKSLFQGTGVMAGLEKLFNNV